MPPAGAPRPTGLETATPPACDLPSFFRACMETPKDKLLAQLRLIDGVEERPSAVSGGSSLFYRGTEFGHFHHANELDLRLTKALIRTLGLQHPAGSIHHPTRSANSAWIELRFATDADIGRTVELVRRATTTL